MVMNEVIQPGGPSPACMPATNPSSTLASRCDNDGRVGEEDEHSDTRVATTTNHTRNNE
jgi:hypothetical protein